MFKYIPFLLLACSCKSPEDTAREKAKSFGLTNVHCVTEQGDSSNLAFCSSGRQLIICTEDDGCLYVNLDPEVQSELYSH